VNASGTGLTAGFRYLSAPPVASGEFFRGSSGSAFSLTLTTVTFGLLVALLVSGLAVRGRWQRKAVDAVGVGDGDAVELAPPPGCTPGELGTILNGGAAYEQVSATVIDLLGRGHLRVRPLPPVTAEATIWELAIDSGSDALRGYEQVLLDELRVRTGPEEYPNLTKQSNAKVAAALQAAVARQGWFTDDPARSRTAAYVWAGSGVLIGVVTTIILAIVSTWAVVGVGLVLGSLVALLMANRRAVRTVELRGSRYGPTPMSAASFN